MKNWLCGAAVAVLCAGLVMSCTRVWAGDDEDESAVVKAADQVIAGLPAALKTGLDFSKMTPEQRIDFVLTSVQDKVESDVADKFKEQIFEKIKDMTKEGIRAKMFLDTGLPQIKHAYAMGQAFDWSKIDAELSSKVDTRMNALASGVKVIEIGWDAYEAYSDGNWSAAARSVGGNLTEMLAESMIPGYGYIKIGAEMVEFLGNYVLDYATDTAVEGMLESMYGMKSNPQGLAQWLINKSPADITNDINSKFNDGEGFGYVYRGQGTDSGEEAIKDKIHTTLIGLRGELLVKKREQEQKEQKIKQDIENYLQQYRASQAQVKAVADKARQEAAKVLGPVEEFKKKVTALRKQDVEEVVREIETQAAQPGPGGTGEGVPYVPINRSSLISQLEGVYSEVKDMPGSGYDRAVMDRGLFDYYAERRRVLEQAGAANNENCQKALKQVRDQFGPPMADLANRINNAEGTHKDSLIAQLNALSAQSYAMETARSTACSENSRKLGLESAALSEEEKVVQLEAQERADKLSMTLREGLGRIANGLSEAARVRDEAMIAFYEELNSAFTAKSLFTNSGAYVTVEACAGICGIVDGIKRGELEVYTPGNLTAAREEAQAVLEGLKKDQTMVAPYSAKERDILARYQASVISLRKDYESLVCKNLRTEIYGGNAEAQSAMDADVAQYGTGNAGSEVWGILPPSIVTLNVGVDMPSVQPPVKYFTQQMAEVAKREAWRQKKFAEAVAHVEQMLSVFDYYADLDRIIQQIMRMNANLGKVFGPFMGADVYFNQKDGKYDAGLDPKDSDGAAHIRKFEAVWKEYAPFVERLEKNVKAYGKGVKYISMLAGVDTALRDAAGFIAIPDQIKALEDRLAKAEAEYAFNMKSLDEELARLRADFEVIQDESQRPVYEQTLRGLRSMLKQALDQVAAGSMRAARKDDYVQLRDAVEAYAGKRAAAEAKSQEEYRAQLEAESKAAAEAERLRREQANAESMKHASPHEYYGYELLDVRVNSYAVNGVSGEVRVSEDKLVGGQIQITARLNKMDHVAKILFSEDSGRTWDEVSAGQDIDIRFTPIPQKKYIPVIKIKTDDMIDVGMNILPGMSWLVYGEADRSREALEAVQALADAYERQDFGSFSRMISSEFLGNKASLEDGVRFDFDMFTDIRLRIYVNGITQDKGQIVVQTSWDKTQVPRKTGQQQRTTGKTTLVFVQEDGALKIRNLRGHLLYATLSPDIAQSSGLPAATIDDIRDARDDREPSQPGAGETQDDGGLSGDDSGGGAGLTVQSFTLGEGEGFEIATGGVIAFFLADFAYEVPVPDDDRIFTPASDGSYGLQHIAGATQLSDLQTAPTAGYDNAPGFDIQPGNVFAVKTASGNYGKIRITAVNSGTSISFEYAYQPVAGSTDLTTP